MNVLKKLDDAKPYHGFPKLEIGFHKIELFRSMDNKYAKKDEVEKSKSILVELADQVIFLPQYICARMTESDVCELNTSLKNKEEMFLHFGGRHAKNR